VEARFTVALPARGRSILGQWAAQILCQNLPRRAARPRRMLARARALRAVRTVSRFKLPYYLLCCLSQVHPNLSAALPAVTRQRHWRRRRGRALAQRGMSRNSGAPRQVRARGAALRVAGRAGRGGACGVRGGARPRCCVR